MKTVFKIFASILLLANGLGAIYGGLNLITYPNGSSIQLSLDYLSRSPFNDYLIPGIILFFANGVLSLLAFVTILSHRKNYPLFIAAQGCILTGWIVIQIVLIHFNFYNAVFGGVGLLLIFCGWILSKRPFNMEETV
jgi:hypothetical protein